MKQYILKLDEERELRFGFRALRKLRQDLGGKSLDELLDIKVDEIPVVLHAGLVWEDKELTLDKVEELLDETIGKKYTIIELTTIALEALASQMGVDLKKALASTLEEEDPKEKKKKKKVSLTPPKKRP